MIIISLWKLKTGYLIYKCDENHKLDYSENKVPFDSIIFNCNFIKFEIIKSYINMKINYFNLFDFMYKLQNIISHNNIYVYDSIIYTSLANSYASCDKLGLSNDDEALIYLDDTNEKIESWILSKEESSIKAKKKRLEEIDTEIAELDKKQQELLIERFKITSELYD